MSQLYNSEFIQTLKTNTKNCLVFRIEQICDYLEENLEVNSFNSRFLSFFRNEPDIDHQFNHYMYLVSNLEELFAVEDDLYELAEQGEDADIAESSLIEFWTSSAQGKTFFSLLESKNNVLEISKTLLNNEYTHLCNFINKNFSFSIDCDDTYFPIPEFSETVDYDKQDIKFLRCYLPANSQNNFTEKAINIIGAASRDLSKILKSFTTTIISINQEAIVSYSTQKIPGHSCINIESRDFIDHIDDLMHENGHHYLNTYLNHEELILEDDEKIFYSPWRKAPRPIRGLYHAVFTFFWAAKTFFELSSYAKKTNEFNPAEIKKINIRFVEEYMMLDYCEDSILQAHKMEKITQEGIELMALIYEELRLMKNFYIEISKKYENDFEISNLQTQLTQNKKIITGC